MTEQNPWIRPNDLSFTYATSVSQPGFGRFQSGERQHPVWILPKLEGDARADVSAVWLPETPDDKMEILRVGDADDDQWPVLFFGDAELMIDWRAVEMGHRRRKGELEIDEGRVRLVAEPAQGYGQAYVTVGYCQGRLNGNSTRIVPHWCLARRLQNDDLDILYEFDSRRAK